MSASDCVYPFPGRTQRLRRLDTNPDRSTATRASLNAIDILRSAWEPLSAEVILFAVDGDDPLNASLVDVARPHRLLVKTSVGAGVRIDAVMSEPVITTTDELSQQAIETWLVGALHDVATSERQHCDWAELYFSACRAWVGPVGWRSGEAELRLQHDTGTVVVPIERTFSGAWLSGPRDPAFDQPPLQVQIRHEEGALTLRLTHHYGFWGDPHEPAAQRLDEIIHRLRAIGWAA